MPRIPQRKSIGLGGDYALAVAIAPELDETIKQWDARGEAVDIDRLKQIAIDRKEGKKAQSSHLRIVEKDSLQSLWRAYVSFHVSTGCWEETDVVTHIQTVD